MKFYGTAHRAKTKLDLEGERHMGNIRLGVTSRVKYTWGRWHLDTLESACIYIMLTPDCRYEIELSTCRTARARELWLEHMAEKRFITPIDLVDLRRAFKDLIEKVSGAA